MGKRELVALLNLSSWCLVMVERLFLALPQGCLPFVIVLFPDHTHLLFTMTPQIDVRLFLFNFLPIGKGKVRMIFLNLQSENCSLRIML